MPDPLYVWARAALLDAVEALGAHRDAIVLVGAQAIYPLSSDPRSPEHDATLIRTAMAASTDTA
jgi:hypothetical protein